MVKFTLPLFFLLLLFSCQEKKISKANLAAYDEIGYQYTSKLFKQYNFCVDSFDQVQVWQPKGSLKPIKVTGLITCIPCLHIIKPTLRYKQWIENPELYKLLPRTSITA